MPEECSHGELIARVVALEAELSAFKELMDERDRRYELRSDAQDAAVAAASSNSDRAINKAQEATERRLEGLNEIRNMALDQAKTFASSSEVKLLMAAFEEKLEALRTLYNAQMSRGTGIKEAWAYFAVGAGLLLTAMALYFRH